MDDARFAVRLLYWQAGLTLAGLAGWALARGTNFAFSFLVGALAAAASFWLLHRMTFSVGPGSAKPTWTAFFGIFRLLLIGATISAILTTYELKVIAAGTGILVVVVSLLLELLRGLFHGT